MISLYLAAFITIFVCNLVHTEKFHGNLKPPDNFLKILHNLETNHQLISPPSFKDIENKEGNYMGLQMFQAPPPPQILCLQVSVLIIHWHYFRVS